jgi:Putative polyhydroxyalkanoic acid system protein (PHA_gran_rgn)
MKIEIQHQHSKEDAKSRLENLIQELKNEYAGQIQNMNEQWANYTDNIEVSAKGYSISGIIEVKESIVSVDLKIPFILLPFSKKIRSLIEDHVKKGLS